METIPLIISFISNYIGTLDWPYIITFILLCYGANHFSVKEAVQKTRWFSIRTRYRVIIIGLLYGVILYIVRGYTLAQTEILFQSLVFGLVFHKLIIEAVLYWLVKHGLPETIAKHFLDEEQLKKLKL